MHVQEAHVSSRFAVLELWHCRLIGLWVINSLRAAETLMRPLNSSILYCLYAAILGFDPRQCWEVYVAVRWRKGASSTLTRAGHADMALERMELNIMALLPRDMECIAEIQCLKLYCQRLGCNLSDGAAVRRTAGCAFALVAEALSDIAILQFPPSLTAAAILVAARRAQARAGHIMLALYHGACDCCLSYT